MADGNLDGGRLSGSGSSTRFIRRSIKPTDSLSVQGIRNASLPSFTENLLANNRKVAQVNVLVVDFIKPEFDRSAVFPPRDPKPEVAFEVANNYLARGSRLFENVSDQTSRGPERSLAGSGILRTI